MLETNSQEEIKVHEEKQKTEGSVSMTQQKDDIFSYFKDEKREDIILAISMLFDNYRAFIYKKFGYNLSKNEKSFESRFFRRSIIQKINIAVECIKNNRAYRPRIRSNNDILSKEETDRIIKEAIENKAEPEMLLIKRNEKDNIVNIPQTYRTIFDLYPHSTKENIKKAISLLRDDEKAITYLRFGYDLSDNVSSEETKVFYPNIYNKISKILKLLEENKPYKPRLRKRELYLPQEQIDRILKEAKEYEKQELTKKEEEKIELPKKKEEEHTLTNEENANQTKDINSENKSIQENKIEKFAKEDYISLLKMFNNKLFIEYTKSLDIKDIIVLSLKLGYVDGKYFTSAAIAEFLGISIIEVDEIVNNNLKEYKNMLLDLVDKAILSENQRKLN